MINLFYESSYWGHTNGMNGPKKVVHNLIASLEQEGISYAVNVEEHKNNFLIQYDWTGHVKHSNLTLENCVIGPQIWMFDGHVNELKENPHYYKSIIAPSQWVKDLYVDKFGYPEEKISVWPVGIDISEQLEKNIEFDCLVYYKRRSDQELRTVTEFLERKNLSYKLFCQLDLFSLTNSESYNSQFRKSDATQLHICIGLYFYHEHLSIP